MNNWFKIQPINRISSQANARARSPFVQGLKLALKGIIYLLTLEIGMSEFHLTFYVPSYLLGLTSKIEGLLDQYC